MRDDAARDSVEKRAPNRLDSVGASHLGTSGTIQLPVLARAHSCAVASVASVRAGSAKNRDFFVEITTSLNQWWK